MDYHNQNLIEFLIIGGGVAGLAVANRLADLNASSLIIEAGLYPSQKVCGEFLSPECLPFLEEWGIIPDHLISRVRLFKKNLSFTFPFPLPAGSMSRINLEGVLIDRAQKKGCHILFQTQVLEIKTPHQTGEKYYLITLSNGETLKVKNLFIGAGRLAYSSSTPPPQMKYTGFKAHFHGVKVEDTLHMHLLPGAYVGISQVEKDVVNVACLAKRKMEVSSMSSLNDYLFRVPQIKEVLAKGHLDSVGWLKTSIPEFTIKTTPSWDNAYFIGDAAGTIPPATGDGLAMAITSGYLAANYALNQDPQGFKNAWQDHYRLRIRYGKILHHLMMRPFLSAMALYACKWSPALPKKLFSLTRS